MSLLTKSMVVLPCLFCCCLLFHSWSVENEEKKNKKVERVGILMWCEMLIYSTWGRQTLALACISSLFLLHATVFSFFFCQVVNAWQYPLFSEWVWCYACVSTRCRFGDVCSGCGLFLHPRFCHMNKNVHTRCAYSFSPLNFLAWLRLPLNFQGSAEWMVQCWVIALTFFVCLFVCSSDIHARFSLFCIYFVSWLCTCHVHLRNMLWTLHDRCMSCKQVLFYNYDVFFFLFLFFHFEAGQAFWGW